ncbi:MAG: DUF4153 domain-containing protein [Anaerolineales bacterium]
MASDDNSKLKNEHDWITRWPLRLTIVVLLLAILWERFFYGRPIGISYPLWIALALMAGFAWAFYEGRRPSLIAISLTIPVLALAALVPLRVEPLTTFLAISLSVLLGIFWLGDFRPGSLLRWRWLDYIVATFLLPLESFLRPWPTLAAVQAELTRGESWSIRLLALLRGLLLALPVAIVFLVLLSSADLIFADWVEEALQWINLERLFDFLGRTTLVLLVAVVLLGAWVASMRRSREEGLVRDGEPILPSFLGVTEAGLVLGTVDSIFALFVLVQFRYFFGGEANISQAGYTYAEYARRGFGELVAVSFLTLGLILVLSSWTKQEIRQDRALFRSLSALAVAFTGVMLVSAMFRLQLYERAYGFTRLRTYTHVAIILLAILFAAFLLLLFMGRLRRFAGVCLLGGVGFALALAAINVDKLIVEQNFEHLEEIGELDSWFLTTLSDDAVPALVARLEMVPQEDRPVLLAGLSCRRHLLNKRAEQAGWPSFRWPHQQASAALENIEGLLDEYPVEKEENYSQIKLGEEEYFYCYDFDFR